MSNGLFSSTHAHSRDVLTKCKTQTALPDGTFALDNCQCLQHIQTCGFITANQIIGWKYRQTSELVGYGCVTGETQVTVT